MNLTDLETFLLVASSGSVTAAAKSLGVPKSTVSRRVQRLEEALDQPLVTRSPNRVRLTTQGVLLHERCAPALATIHNAERELEGLAEEPIGRVRVTTLSLLGLAPMLADLFLEFLERHPRVTLDVRATDQVMDLVEERIDLAIRPMGADPAGGDVRLRRQQLGTLDGSLYASPDYLERHGRPDRLEQIPEHVHVADPVIAEGGAVFEGPRGEQRRIHLDARYFTSSIAHVLTATCRGATLGLLPSFLAAPEVARGRLVPLLGDWRLRGARIGLVYPAASGASAKTRAIVEFLQEHAVASGLVSAPRG